MEKIVLLSCVIILLMQMKNLLYLKISNFNQHPMPTYIFKNTKTEEVFEQQMRISELDDFKKSNPDLIQMPTAPSFRLKGTGWYETDFKTGKKKNIAKSDSETQTTNKTKDKNDASKASS